MKYKCILLLLLIAFTTAIKAQSPGESFAIKVAQRLKDSLALTSTQQQAIYTINMQLHDRKMSIWQSQNDTESLQRLLQRVETSRDSLYRPVLSREQYEAYLKRKSVLLNNN